MLGLFEFDLYGKTAFAYAPSAWCWSCSCGVRLILRSPFGLALRGIHDSRKRMLAIGSPVESRLRMAYALSAAVAGVAGALLAQTTQFVGIESIGFNRSAEVLIILVLGGTGRLYGGMIGAMVYMLVHDWLRRPQPAVLDVLARHLPDRGRHAAAAAASWARCPHLVKTGARHERRAAHPRPGHALRRLPARSNDVQPHARTRRAPGADRPQRRRQDHADQPADRRDQANRGPHRAWASREHHRASAADKRACMGLARTFQINTLFPSLTPLLSVVLAISEREGLGAVWWRPLMRHKAAFDEAHALLGRLKLDALADVPVAELAYGKQRLLEIALAMAAKPRILLLDEPAAGVPEDESGELFEAIAELPQDISVLFIEHDMNLVFRFSRRISVLVGRPDPDRGHARRRSAADPRVREVYLSRPCELPMAELLAFDQVRRRLRQRRGARPLELRARAGPEPRHPRTQRRGQDHACSRR